MPDLLTLIIALAAAGFTAALLLALGHLPWRQPARVAVGWVLGVALGFALGCALLGIRPHWPPREDQDRLLLLLLPAVVVVELAALAPLPRWQAWALRALVALAAGRVLLHGTSYITDLTGPGSSAWTPAQTALTLGGLALALLAVWAALAVLAARPAGRSLPLMLALACGAAAVTVMLSGYASGGQLGLPLAAALAGAALAAFCLPASAADLPIGFGVVGLFGLLFIGRYFGTLTPANATLLGLTPLLGWLAELPLIVRIPLRWRTALPVPLDALLLTAAVSQARQQYAAAAGPAPAGREASIDDYRNYGR